MLPSGSTNGQRQDVIPHRSVTHGVCPRGPRRDHAAERGVGARIDREEQAAVAKMLIELAPGDARFDRAVQVVGVNGNDPLHARRID
jgi:hypothetical protein